MSLLRSLRQPRRRAGWSLLIGAGVRHRAAGRELDPRAGRVGGPGALAAAGEHRPGQRPGLLRCVRGPLGGAVPGAPERQSCALRVLEEGDSAYAFQRRYRRLASLTTADRYIVNKIADNQAQIEVAYAMAHALTDLGRHDEARRMAELARAPVGHAAGRRARALAGADHPLAGARRRPAAARPTSGGRCCGCCSWPRSSSASRSCSGPCASVDRPLSQLIGAAERFGAGDLRPLQLGGDADRDRAARPRDGRHGRPAPRRGGRRWSARRARSATARATSPP